MESLRQVFKTLADPTRLRLLALLEREELAVQELTEVLGMAQSTVSRHLAILREAGLLRDRRDGTFVYYRLAAQDGAWREAWQLAKRRMRGDPIRAADEEALDAILEARAVRTRRWFDSVAPEWDALRKVFHDDLQRARAITRLVPRGLTVADIGTGTGILAAELAALGIAVIAVDHSPPMLDNARARLEADGVEGVELRLGEAGALPLADGEVDAAFAHMVLQHLASPADAVREMHRVVRPGGTVVLVDFVQHDRAWMKDRLGVQWSGFPLDTVRSWFEQADLDDISIEPGDPPARNKDLPATFIATGHRKPTARAAIPPRLPSAS